MPDIDEAPIDREALMAELRDIASFILPFVKPVWLTLNKAKAEEIILIPGVGPKMRHEFEEYRPYRNIEQFRREIGKYVDEKEVARLERYVSIR